MASVESFWDGFKFLIIGVLTSLIFVFIVTIAVDGTITQLEAIGDEGEVLDVPDPWATAATTDLYFWQRLAYAFAISPAILGVIAQYAAAVRRERVEEFGSTQSFLGSDDLEEI